jgi:steroid delta-isomerase-like uncharacterized protein
VIDYYERENSMSATVDRTRLSQIYEEVINARRLDQAIEFFAPDVVEQEPLPGTEGYEGLHAHKRFLMVMFEAFPDYQENIEEIIADENKAMVRFSATGTHHGALMGLPPTGRQVSTQGIDIYRVAEGKIV